MFITPLFGGCKYTNKILIINNIAVFQHFNLLITPFILVSNRPEPQHMTLFELNEKLAVSLLSSATNPAITQKSY